jgi:hypothetical protein
MAITVTQATGVAASVSLATGTLLTEAQAVAPNLFQQVCQCAMVTYANAVMGEDPTVPSADSRKDYARNVLGNPITTTFSAMWSITCDGVTGPTSSDDDILARIEAIWPALSNGI